jgi:hypothetical protein
VSEENKVIPFRVKYKGYTITQTYGEVIITDVNRRAVLTIPIQKPKQSIRELKELFDFNESLMMIRGGGDNGCKNLSATDTERQQTDTEQVC